MTALDLGSSVSADQPVPDREQAEPLHSHSLKFTAIAVLLLAAVATGAGFLGRATAMQDKPKASPVDPQSPKHASPNDANPAPGRMFVAGRVLDPQGNPVPNAAVMVYARTKLPGRISDFHPAPIGHGAGDGSGRFRLDAPRTSSSRHSLSREYRKARHHLFEADAEGRFGVNPLSADRFSVAASAPEGLPNLSAVQHF
jgi:hypothetical protein